LKVRSRSALPGSKCVRLAARTERNNVKALATFHSEEVCRGPFNRIAVQVTASPDSDVDRKAIESALAANLQDVKDALARFLARCQKEFLPPYIQRAGFGVVSDEDVAHLLRRLADDILPNIIPDATLLGTPARFATILNASALYRVSMLLKRDATKGPDEIYRELQKLERLTAKAFEVSYIQRQFNDWKAARIA
jgi:hypothetical protein